MGNFPNYTILIFDKEKELVKILETQYTHPNPIIHKFALAKYFEQKENEKIKEKIDDFWSQFEELETIESLIFIDPVMFLERVFDYSVDIHNIETSEELETDIIKIKGAISPTEKIIETEDGEEVANIDRVDGFAREKLEELINNIPGIGDIGIFCEIEEVKDLVLTIRFYYEKNSPSGVIFLDLNTPEYIDKKPTLHEKILSKLFAEDSPFRRYTLPYHGSCGHGKLQIEDKRQGEAIATLRDILKHAG